MTAKGKRRKIDAFIASLGDDPQIEQWIHFHLKGKVLADAAFWYLASQNGKDGRSEEIVVLHPMLKGRWTSVKIGFSSLTDAERFCRHLNIALSPAPKE